MTSTSLGRVEVGGQNDPQPQKLSMTMTAVGNAVGNARKFVVKEQGS